MVNQLHVNRGPDQRLLQRQNPARTQSSPPKAADVRRGAREAQTRAHAHSQTTVSTPKHESLLIESSISSPQQAGGKSEGEQPETREGRLTRRHTPHITSQKTRPLAGILLRFAATSEDCSGK